MNKLRQVKFTNQENNSRVFTKFTNRILNYLAKYFCPSRLRPNLSSSLLIWIYGSAPSPCISAVVRRGEVADDVNSKVSVSRSMQHNNCISSRNFTIFNCPLNFKRIYCAAVKKHRAKPEGWQSSPAKRCSVFPITSPQPRYRSFTRCRTSLILEINI